MSGSPSHPPPSGRDTISAHIYLPPQARCLENLVHGATCFVLSARLWCAVTSNLANSVRRMKNCCAVHLIMYLLLKTSRKASPRIQTHHRSPCYPYSFKVQHSRGERVRFCFAAGPHLTECEDALVANVWTLWSRVPWKLWSGWREISMGSGERIVSALPP